MVPHDATWRQRSGWTLAQAMYCCLTEPTIIWSNVGLLSKVFYGNNLRAVSQHYSDAIMGAIASQITSLTIVYSTVSSDADQRKHQSSTSLAFVRGIHWGPMNSSHKWPVAREMFPLVDVIMRIAHGLIISMGSEFVKNILQYLCGTSELTTLKTICDITYDFAVPALWCNWILLIHAV